MKKILTPVILCLATGIIFSLFIQSCKSSKSLAKPSFTPIGYIVVQQPIHDTVRLKSKPLTELEKQQMVDKFYEYGYKKYYGPQFEKLLQANAKLVQDIHILTLENKSIRVFSRRKRDSLEKTSNYYQEQALRYQKEKLESDKLNTSQQARALEKSDSTLKAVNRTTKVLSIFGIILGTLVIILFIIASYLRSKINMVAKELEMMKKLLDA